MMAVRSVLILGASYGLLPGVKLALAGHQITFVGRDDEIASLSECGLCVRIPLRRETGFAELRTRKARFATPSEAAPDQFDMIFLAMQEPQLAHPHMIDLLSRIAASKRPCLSIMNLPPPAFLTRIGIPQSAMDGVFTAGSAWDDFTPGKVSNTSPDPQALRMDPDRPGELTVTLPSNFKAAPFESAEDQSLLEQLARDLSRSKVAFGGSSIAPPVRMLAHSSPYIPLAKWPILIAGNSRCLTGEGVRSIAEAVHSDLSRSKRIYDQVVRILGLSGCPEQILVPFEAYADAAKQLTRPSSAARALSAGAQKIERIDRLVLNLAIEYNAASDDLHSIHDRIEKCLLANRR